MSAFTARQVVPADFLPIVLRAYAEPPPRKPVTQPKSTQRPSEWTLVFDTETTTDAGQALRFGTYQVRKGSELYESGLFYRPEVMAADEITLLTRYAERHGSKLRTQADFVKNVFYGVGYDLRATIVGFNLPFDVSRLASRHGHARRSMRGGFSFTLTEDKPQPAIRIKHLSRRISFFKFAAPFRQRLARSDRRRGRNIPARGGFFLDVNTLAHALLSRSFSLETLADHLGTSTRKVKTHEHGGPLTADYVEYAVHDTQVTWECYIRLADDYAKLRLDTPVHRIYSEASLGKAYLSAMNVRPWREAQPNFPAEIIGVIMSTFFGGRSEVRIRRQMRQVVLCDFLSMYPTLCTLMGLWRFAIAKGLEHQEDTAATQALLDSVSIATLEQRVAWCDLTVLVQVEPAEDILPTRADYDGSGSTTIGLNHLSSKEALWFTLSDCIANKLLTERTPKILRAIRFLPMAAQRGLRSIEINGDPECKVRPTRQDFYKRLIEVRQSVKAARDAANGSDRERFDTLQNAVKIAANATSYGIFAEVNVEDLNEDRTTALHVGSAEPFQIDTDKAEEPGRFFHPLLATLITGAARLMLSLAERLVCDAGLEWMFCDTDSMAICRPVSMDETTFYSKVDSVAGWFKTLNPYDFSAPILKIEGVNASLDDGSRREALFGYAVSAKRYALFNIDKQGHPALRKASAHGLGHLRKPYDERTPAPDIPLPSVKLSGLGVALWQHDLWWLIARAALRGPVVQLSLDHHPALAQPAISRYAATTPAIHGWFSTYNKKQKSFDEQVKPFGFLLAFHARPGDPVRPVAPFASDHDLASQKAFDRQTGLPVLADRLASYQQVLAQYHLHPEAKFQSGDRLDSGTTYRRHVQATRLTYIGKETNRLEEQLFLGDDEDALVGYPTVSRIRDLSSELDQLRQTISLRELSDRTAFPRATLSKLLSRETVRIKPRRLAELERNLIRVRLELQRMKDSESVLREQIRQRIASAGLKTAALVFEQDASNLGKIAAGKRRIPHQIAESDGFRCGTNPSEPVRT